ncbi:MAG TPA: NAD-dependent epimerase/dehydratase family protein [Ktedonobacteraceae bacterium]|jgi:nucleoside-diphosphate-sugar epimerase|nr:NAD-dependent epimerase/dehydratase family protein [Ktedonobacteraceae bacterium]
MNILVTGGTGFLGRHLVQALLEHGHNIFCMGRDFTRVQEQLAAGAQPVHADLRVASAVIAACEHMDAVYHAGAFSAPWGRRRDFYEINVDGTEALIAGCRRYGVRRLIYISSPSVVFDGQDQHNITESAAYPRHFASLYSRTKKLGEDRINVVKELETVIVRPKAIFGPGDQTLLPRLLEAAKQKRLPQIGNGQNLVDLTYVGNVVHALLLALEAPAAVGNTYFVTNDEHILLWQVIRTVLRENRLSTDLRTIPLSVALAAAGLMELRAALTKKEPLLTRYSVQILARTQTYDISALKRDLNYAPLISVAEGVERTLASWKES